jgi:D-serine deaminase-like pyridoxal phosphate-dependent protein
VAPGFPAGWAGHNGGMAGWQVPQSGMTVPGLVVDEDVLDRNLAAMAQDAARRGIALRPHVKTHKCLEIARRQLGLGAIGLSVATVGEAEVFADGGFADLFIAYPVWAGGGRGERLARLARRVALLVGADSPAAVRRLAGALGDGATAGVMVEVDCGLARSGVAPRDAAAVAAEAAAAGLEVAGVFTFPGHSYAPGAGPAAAADEAAALAQAAGALEAAGIPCPVRSGGSTPTAALAQGGAVTELRPGVYAFNDAQQVTLGTCGMGEVALAAVATVVSVPTAGRFVLDAGSKILGPDRPAWAPGHGLLPGYPGWRVSGLWEHHAVVTRAPAGAGPHGAGTAAGHGGPAEDGGPAADGEPAAGDEPPKVGERVIVVPNHVCTAVNLASELYVMRDGKVSGRWPVSARGRNT